jgi:hypothetical protein
MTQWYSWDIDGEAYATVAGRTATDSVFLTPSAPLTDRAVDLRLVFDERGPLPLGDFAHTGLSQPKVLSERAWHLLRRWLASSGRAVLARIDGVSEPCRIWYPGVVADCLDENRSTFRESLSAYRRVESAVFHASSAPRGVPFVVRGFETQNVWVEREFVESVQNEGLRGATFRNSAKAV